MLCWHDRKQLQDRHLPQGAPTSPVLANLCAYRLDLRLVALAKSLGVQYTRYADDLAFSWDKKLFDARAEIHALVGAIALEEGFCLNTRKTKMMEQNKQQKLTGIVINRHLNVSRKSYDRLKAILTNCVRLGPMSQNRKNHHDFKSHLNGRVHYVIQLNPAKGMKLKKIFDQIEWGSMASGCL